MFYLSCMKNGKKKNGQTHENVRISKNILNPVRKFCDENKIKIGGFFEIAAQEKIQREHEKINQ